MWSMVHQILRRELRAAFDPDLEVGVFSGAADLAKRIAWWLAHDAERVSAAERAWERSQRDQYTYARAVDSSLENHRIRSEGP